MEIALGTAQFGLDYGISNTAGRVPESEVRSILDTAIAGGVRVVDTAAAYGDCEALLGRVLPPGDAFQLVTKLPKVPSDLAAADAHHWVRGSALTALKRLRRKHIHGLLMHDAGDLLSHPAAPAIWRALVDLRTSKLVERVGASVYGGAEVDSLLARCDGFDLIQLPIGPLDQRFIANGRLATLKKAGVEIHARSLLLQGLLTLPPDRLPAHFAPAASRLSAMHAAFAETRLKPVAIAVAFAAAVPQIDHAVFGVTTAAEFAELLQARPHHLPLSWFARFALEDETILNPALWPR